MNEINKNVHSIIQRLSVETCLPIAYLLNVLDESGNPDIIRNGSDLVKLVAEKCQCDTDTAYYQVARVMSYSNKITHGIRQQQFFEDLMNETKLLSLPRTRNLPQKLPGDSQLGRCGTWLCRLLSSENGRYAKDIFTEGKKRGFSKSTIDRTKRMLKIKPKKDGKGAWHWILPAAVNE
jgi:hypothetical protein